MKQKRMGIAAFLMLLLCGVTSARGQWVQETGFGGAIFCFAGGGVGGSPSMLFAGRNGSVLRSTDSGVSWAFAPDTGLRNQQGYGPLVLTLVMLGSNTSSPTLIAGTDAGVFRSSDEGANWTLASAGLNVTRPGNALLIIPYPLAISGNNLVAAPDSSGVFVSTDTGTSWKRVNVGPANTVVLTLAAIGEMLIAGTNAGVFRSTDHGSSWALASINTWDAATQAFAVDGTTLYAAAGNVFRSTDSGTTWTDVSSGLGNHYVTCLEAVSMGSSPSILFEGSYGGIDRSTDGGANWTSVNSGLQDTSVVMLGSGDSYVFASIVGSIWRRPLSDFNNSAVLPSTSFKNSLISYPNPFSQSTTISFTSPESGVAEVSVVNILGATVARIFSGEMDAGAHSFTWEARGLPAGVYECIVHMNGKVERMAMVVN